MKASIVCSIFALFATHITFAQSQPSAGVEQFRIVVADVGGDYITGGRNYEFNSSNGKVSASGSKKLVQINYESNDRSDWWSFEFEAGRGRNLKAGSVFKKAIRYPFNDHGIGTSKVNGISVSSTGRGCNTIKGQFRINKIAFDKATDMMTELDLSFVQHCEGGTGAVHGRIALKAKVPDLGIAQKLN